MTVACRYQTIVWSVFHDMPHYGLTPCTYYFNQGRYANALAGLTHLDTKKNTFSAYRFHDDDPLFFQRGLRLTCRCGEELNGKMLHNPPDTRFTTYTWIYQW